MRRDHVTMFQGVAVLLFAAAIGWSAVRIVEAYRHESDIEDLKAWRSVAERALRDCSRTRQALGE